MRKSELTKSKILNKGMELASSIGLQNISIGKMAEAIRMSRTGVISHFSDKEDMQMAILKYAEKEFKENVISNSYSKNPLEHIINLKENWVDWVENLEFQKKVSCPFFKASVEYLDLPNSKVRNYIKDQQTRLIKYIASIAQKCVDQGFFKKETNVDHFAYELYSIYLGHSIQKKLINSRTADGYFRESVEQMISRHKIAPIKK